MSLSDLLLLMFVYGGAGGSGCAQDHQIGKSLFLRQAVGRLVLNHGDCERVGLGLSMEKKPETARVPGFSFKAQRP
jgi:hypothetical protein